MKEAKFDPDDQNRYALSPPPKFGAMRLVKLPAHIPNGGDWSTRAVAVTNEMSVNEEFRKAVAKFLT